MIQCRGIWCAQSSPKLRYLVLRLINSFTIVASAMAPDSRSDEGAMLIHCDRGATTKTGPFLRNTAGRSGLRAISSSRFVGDERASPSSSLLDLASQAPSAMVKLFMKRNTSSFPPFPHFQYPRGAATSYRLRRREDAPDRYARVQTPRA